MMTIVYIEKSRAWCRSRSLTFFSLFFVYLIGYHQNRKMNFQYTLNNQNNNSVFGTSLDYQQQQCYYQPQPQYSDDVLRRLSYTEMLSQSDSSLSDGEHQLTPSPMLDYYEDKMMGSNKVATPTVPSCAFDYPPSAFYQPFQSMMMNEMYLSPSNLLYPNVNSTTYQQPMDMYTSLSSSSSSSASSSSSPSLSPTFGSLDVSSASVASSSDCDYSLLSSSPSKSNATTLSRSSKTIKKKHASAKKTLLSSVGSSMTRVKKEADNCGSAALKNFECTEGDCQKVFKRSEHLKRHIRSIHTKEKRKYKANPWYQSI
jgi:hypothetical protein